MKGVSVGMCHRRGRQGRGGLCVGGEDIYAGVADTEEQASHLREPCDRQRQVGNACGTNTSRPALSAWSLSGESREAWPAPPPLSFVHCGCWLVSCEIMASFILFCVFRW